MSAKYCKRVGCSCDQSMPCAAADDCVLFQWDLDRIKSVQPKRGDSRTPTEAEEQEELVAWCEMKRIPIIHIPNERKCSAAAAASLSRQGLRKGFPDNFIPIAGGKYHGLFIELKRGKKSLSRVSPEQREWVKALNAQGYKALISYGAEAAKSVITEYLNLKQNR